MSYSKKNKKWSPRDVILMSWLVIAILAVIVGVIIGVVIVNVKTPETLIYGQYDGKIYTGELPRTWEVNDKEFTPMDVPLDADLQEFIFYLSAAYEIDPTLVMAVIKTESNFDPNAVGRTNDYGLMQINRINHQWLHDELGVTNFLDPYDNVKSGMFILRKLFEKYEDPAKVLMAYNMGEGGAARLWKQGVYETNYTKTVFANQRDMAGECDG